MNWRLGGRSTREWLPTFLLASGLGVYVGYQSFNDLLKNYAAKHVKAGGVETKKTAP